MEQMKKIIKKLSIVFAVVLMLGTMLLNNATETKAATTKLHTFFKEQGNELVYGFKNDKGKVVIKAKYREAGHFSEDLCAVSENTNEWSYINTKGKTVFRIAEPAYDCGRFMNGVAVISMSGQKYLIDKTGKRLNQNNYQDIKRLRNGCFEGTTDYSTPHSILNKKGEALIESCPGNLVVYTKYGFLFQSQDGELFVYNINGKQILSAKEGSYMLVDNAVWYAQSENTDYTIYNWSGNKIGKVDKKIKLGNPVEAIGNQADPYYYHYSDKLHVACNGNGKYGYVDCKGKFVIKPVYNGAAEFFGNTAVVQKGKQYCLINKKGKITAKFSGLQYARQLTAQLIQVYRQKDGKEALINTKGKYVWKYGKAINYSHTWTNESSINVFIDYHQNGKHGLISGTTGKVIIPAKYVKAYDTYNLDFWESETEQYIKVKSGSTTTYYELDGTKMGASQRNLTTYVRMH